MTTTAANAALENGNTTRENRMLPHGNTHQTGHRRFHPVRDSVAEIGLHPLNLARLAETPPGITERHTTIPTITYMFATL